MSREKFNDTSNPWFIVSVIVTIFLIILLVLNLLHSYSTVKNFESEKLAMERASGNILYHAKNLEMAVQMAAATGNLRWQNTYDEHQPELNKNLKEISELTNFEEASHEIENIQNNLNEINKIEQEAFTLISRGEKEKAAKLLSRWAYTKNQLELSESSEKLTSIIQNHVREKISFERNLASISLILVILSLILLIVSWSISIETWRINLKKRREKEYEIIYLSYHDPLTGLYNRRFFEEEYSRLDVKRTLPLTIVIGDVNGLKKVNDELGHKKGDELIMEIAQILKSSVREEDIVARWGGDEFGIILPNTSSEDAQKVIDRIKENCEKSTSNLSPSISLGYSVKTDISQDINKVFAQAENEMYRNKK